MRPESRILSASGLAGLSAQQKAAPARSCRLVLLLVLLPLALVFLLLSIRSHHFRRSQVLHLEHAKRDPSRSRGSRDADMDFDPAAARDLVMTAIRQARDGAAAGKQMESLADVRPCGPLHQSNPCPCWVARCAALHCAALRWTAPPG
jgi:hypothetical protein